MAFAIWPEKNSEKSWDFKILGKNLNKRDNQ